MTVSYGPAGTVTVAAGYTVWRAAASPSCCPALSVADTPG